MDGRQEHMQERRTPQVAILMSKGRDTNIPNTRPGNPPEVDDVLTSPQFQEIRSEIWKACFAAVGKRFGQEKAIEFADFVQAAIVADKHAISLFLIVAADHLAEAVFQRVENGGIETRTAISDSLEKYLDVRFEVMDGSGYGRLRDFLEDRERHQNTA